MKKDAFPPGSRRSVRAAVVAATTLALTVLPAVPARAGDHPLAGTGTTWTQMTTPPVASGVDGVELDGISCIAPYDCIAVGSAQELDGTTPIAEQLGFDGWSMLAQPQFPSGATRATFDDVSCVGPTFCMAVGASTIGGRYEPLAELFDGSTWTVVDTPRPSGDDSPLNSVSCTSRSFCVAVGTGIADPEQLYAEMFNGTQWRRSGAIVPRGSEESDLSGISCRVRVCFAVGSVAIGLNQSGFAFRSLIERYESSRWTVVATSDPSGSLYSNLQSVSCVNRADCVAVGDSISRTTDDYLTYSLSGSTWTRVAGTTSVLNVFQTMHIRCRSANACVSVGFNATSTGEVPLVEHFNGSTWSSAEVQSGATGALEGVACFVPVCVAVGWSSTTRALALIS